MIKEILISSILFILSIVIDRFTQSQFTNVLFWNRINLIYNSTCILILAICLLVSGSFPIQIMQEYFRVFLVLFTIQQLMVTPCLLFFCITQSMIITGVFTVLFLIMFTSGLETFNLESFIIRMGVVGVTIMAGLSGFAAVSTPLNNMSAFKIEVDQKVLDNVKRQLMTSIDMVLNKKKYVLRNSDKIDSFWGKFNFFSSSSMESEISNLSSFVDELYLDLIDLQNESENHRFGQTIMGKIMNFLGYIFSGVCVFKVFNSLLQLSFKKVGVGEGPVRTALTLMAEKHGVQIDVSYWSNILSLVFIAILMVSSIRSFLLQSFKVIYFMLLIQGF